MKINFSALLLLFSCNILLSSDQENKYTKIAQNILQVSRISKDETPPCFKRYCTAFIELEKKLDTFKDQLELVNVKKNEELIKFIEKIRIGSIKKEKTSILDQKLIILFRVGCNICVKKREKNLNDENFFTWFEEGTKLAQAFLNLNDVSR